MDIKEIGGLLQLFSRDTVRQKRRLNFFDVSGYPHYENVVSNILGFYFDTDEEHGLKDLWLKSLLECYIETPESQYELTDESYSTAEVLREVTTKENKRIDLLIRTNNNLIVVIENKIDSSVNNPFKEYHKKAEELNSDNQCTILEILLSVREEKLNNEEGHYFINITYERLLEKIRKNLGYYISDGNEKWVIFLNEFVNNLNSRKETIMMDAELQKVIREYGKQIANLHSEIENDIYNKKIFLNNICDSINRTDAVIFKAKTYGSSKASHISLVVDVKKNDSHTIVYEPYFVPYENEDQFGKAGYLYLAIWDRKSESIGDKVKETFKDNYKVEDVTSGNWGKYVILRKDRFEEVNEKEFLKESIDIIERIASLTLE